MSSDYRINENRHITIRVVVGSICAMLVLVALISGITYTAHQNNEKTTKYGVECMKNGGEWRERNNGEAYCDN
ncbi:hypothetical protein SEA_COMRADE_225 [Streptomyces phage Comrade]|uniref:Uncharacterized protein n=3 Tax=Gilsonvirus comrade TaxID=2846395 RepID=A0A345MEC6_9CAUD|nr:hypothetical protein HWB84_gp053 [Streptomyces phage Comrade]AXH68907.1 hypothetical protein SEA_SPARKLEGODDESS_228 [Streptomyces phage SparkleGoddess]QQO39881.1 membrane protein [Streptomyces phage Belfort]QZE11790.1 membrane protein [Streptomyces phage Karp]UTN92451.1 hypothetical protein SEA_STIGMA_227 [Streptomyces phage Stigma]AXQ63460.1 hypothetical protein SEA_COMRADE_225 [Streptomyces phage Comrade]